MSVVKSQIEEKVREAVKKSFGFEPGGILVYRPPAGLGDYATSVAIQISARVKEKPFEIAGKLAQNLSADLKNIAEDIQVTPEGFINLIIDPQFVSIQIEGLLRRSSSLEGPQGSALVEFVSANPTGPLTLGNARNAFLGQTIANVLEKVGYGVIKHYYVNDTGRQIEQLGKSVLGIEAIYQGSYIADLRKKLRINPREGETRRVGNGTSTRRVHSVGQRSAQIIMRGYIKPTLKRLGITFDEFVSEKALIESSKVKKILAQIKKDGLSYEKEGALWMNLKKLGENQDDVLIKSDGSLTYLATDIAYHWEKMKKADLIVNVLGADNANEARRIKAIGEKYLANSSAFGGKWKGKIVNIVYQLVHLKEGETILKISKREGRMITVEDLLGAVGEDAARFFILLPSADTHLELDLALAKEKSAKNPVYYVQYAHARMASILRKARINPAGGETRRVQDVHLEHPAELALAKKILQYSELLEEVATNFSVHHLPNYAIDLADTFHKFYEQVRVISDDKKATMSRLSLVQAAKFVLKETLELMGINAPERM